MQCEFEIVDVTNHTITRDGPRKGDVVKRLTMMDTDREDMCRAFFNLDADLETEVEKGQRRIVGVTAINIFNGTAYLQGKIKPAGKKVS